MRSWAPCLIAVKLAFILAFMAITPPSPKDLDTPADQFSSARAMEDVRIIAAKPHPTGSVENEKVRAYLTTRLENLGAEVEVETSLLGERALARLNKWSGQSKTEQEIFNVIGTLPGKDRNKPAVLLMAHHDTVWESPGAADDTVGIASILEIARALKETDSLERDLIMLFTDGEEVGLSGARYFFSNNPSRDKIGAVINFEARGGGGTANMFQTSRGNGPLMRLYAKAVKEPSASSLSAYVYNLLPNDTDLTPALEKNYAAYNIANLGEAEYYHSPKITADELDESTLQHMGSQGLDLTRALLVAETLPSQTSDATFFDLFGTFTLIYPSALGWLFLAITVMCLILSFDRKSPKSDIVKGALRMMGMIVLGAASLYILNLMSGSSGANYYDRLAAIPKLEILALIACAVLFFIFFGQKRLTTNEYLGAVLPVFILAILAQFLAPTATYFITLPVLFFSFSALLIRKQPQSGIWVSVIFAAVIFGYMLGLGHLLMLGVGPDMLSVAILPAILAALAMLPLYPGLPRETVGYLILIGIILAIALALWIRLDPIAITVPTY